MKTGIISTNTYLNHNTGEGHPERAERVTVVLDHLKKIKQKNLIWKKINIQKGNLRNTLYYI